MNKAQIRRAVQNKVDDKIQKAIDEVAESQARAKVYDALFPSPKSDAPPSQVQPAEASRSRVYSPNDPKLCGY